MLPFRTFYFWCVQTLYGRRRQRKDICVLFRRAERWHGDLYKLRKSKKIPQADRRAFAGCTLQRLYDLYQERRVCTSGTGTPPRREKSTFQNTREERPLDFSSPAIVRDPNKCILCGNCVRVCDEIRGSVRSILLTAEPMRWSCRHLTGRSQRQTV